MTENPKCKHCVEVTEIHSRTHVTWVCDGPRMAYIDEEGEPLPLYELGGECNEPLCEFFEKQITEATNDQK